MTRPDRRRWLGIELRHVAALSEVAREGSFRGAADRLGYVQSAISQQLAHLEDVIGVRLVDRQRGMSRIALTEAGELLLHHFDAILARFGAAQADIEAVRTGRAGQLRIGVYESVATQLMPRVLADLGRRLPGIDVHIQEGRLDELAAAVSTGVLDVSFGDLPLPPGPFESVELRRDPYVLLAPKDWPIAAARQPATRDALAELPLIGQRERASERVEAELRADGLEPRYRFRSGSNAAVQALVAAGMGAAILPRLGVVGPDERSAVIDLHGVVPPRVLVLFWHADRRRSPALEEFMAVVADACTDEPAQQGSQDRAAR